LFKTTIDLASHLEQRGNKQKIKTSTKTVYSYFSFFECDQQHGRRARSVDGPNLGDLLRRCGDYVAKILHGAKPSDLPIQRPKRFDLVINLKTAEALGISVPPVLLATADEVIE
jgi:hypothetical protein